MPPLLLGTQPAGAAAAAASSTQHTAAAANVLAVTEDGANTLLRPNHSILLVRT